MIPGVRLVVLGKQGAGKGTQCLPPVAALADIEQILADTPPA